MEIKIGLFNWLVISTSLFILFYHEINGQNIKNHANLSCRFCEDNVDESQEHLEVCRGGEFERRKLKMSKWKSKVTFWRRMTTKMNDWGRGNAS